MKKNTLSEIELETVIQIIAERHRVTPQEVRSSMEQDITDMWSTTDPEVKARQHLLFGEERPNLGEFIAVMSDRFRK